MVNKGSTPNLTLTLVALVFEPVWNGIDLEGGWVDIPTQHERAAHGINLGAEAKASKVQVMRIKLRDSRPEEEVDTDGSHEPKIILDGNLRKTRLRSRSSIEG